MCFVFKVSSGCTIDVFKSVLLALVRFRWRVVEVIVAYQLITKAKERRFGASASFLVRNAIP